MAKEIERKYLVKPGAWTPSAGGTTIRQGYLSSVKERVVRVRTKGTKAFLTIKGLTTGISRSEFEYEIPVQDADLLLTNLCEQPLIEKIRHKEVYMGHTWEIDVFFGANDGLTVAEVELTDEKEKLVLPTWVGEEVSSDPRYFNSNLIANPYSKWGNK
ncbi:CYTH domain-containing protein [Anaeroselena agilis]|uniref:CYTH domain-containing protein n=1 Tax=Anaeroselena agilis TaxID=3063788 RepID=A0ABU3NSQ3_9FIRM|nr:CYTH domain-containing protein [Selenomonadales bacterium 4137-cl]